MQQRSGDDVVVFDTETTGLAWHDRLVEVGAVRLQRGAVVARWSTLVDPRRPIPAATTQVHGLTDAMVRGAPPAREALEGLRRFSEGALLAAHYAVYDRGIIAAECARAGLAPLRNPLYCTWRLAKSSLQGAPRFGLAHLATHLGLPSHALHRALPDAELAATVLAVCCERWGGATRAVLDARATSSGTPWSFRGVVRSLRRLPGRARPLRAALERREPVLLSLSDGASRWGVPLALYAQGEDARVDLLEGGAVSSLPLASVRSVELASALGAAA